MTLLQRPLDLLLPLLRQIHIPIKHLKVAIDQALNIRNDLWCKATPCYTLVHNCTERGVLVNTNDANAMSGDPLL